MIEDIIGFMKKAPQMEMLNIGNNHLKTESLIKLLRFSFNSMPQLVNLDLSFTNFETSGHFNRIVDIFKDNKNIKSLNLTCCNLLIEDIEYLGKMLSKSSNNALTEVKACMNRFTEEQLNERFKES